MSAQPDLDTLGTTKVVPFFRPKIFEKPGGFSGADFLIIHKSLKETSKRSATGLNKILRMKGCEPFTKCARLRLSQFLREQKPTATNLNQLLVTG